MQPADNTRTRRPSRRWFALPLSLLCWLLLLPLAPPAAAHATLQRADPAPNASLTAAPERVTLWFTAPIVARYSRIAVLDASGASVVAGPLLAGPTGGEPALSVALVADLPDGAYTVVWSVYSSVSAHITEGVFSFTVGSATLPTPEQEAALAAIAFEQRGVWPPVEIAARWFNLLGSSALFGVLAFVALLLVPVYAAPVPAQRIRAVVAAALAVLLAGHLVTAVAQVIDVTGGSLPGVLGEPLVTLLTRTSFGALWLARSALLPAVALTCWMLTRRRYLLLPRRNSVTSIYWGVALATSALLLLTTSLGSHAATAETRRWLAIATDYLHLLAAAVLVGGLLGLAAILPPIHADRRDATLLRQLLQRFGRAAALAAGTAGLTGLLAARRHIGSWDGLVTTEYGLWFIVKLLVIALALGFAAWQPLLHRARGAGAVARSHRAQAALAGAVILAAAGLTSTVPAAVELDDTQPVYAETLLVEDVSVTFRAAPGKVGLNEFSLVVATANNAFRLPPEAVTLVFEPGESALTLSAPSPSNPWTFRATGEQINAAGPWRVTAEITWPDRSPQFVTFELDAIASELYPAGFAPRHTPNTGLLTMLGFAWLGVGLLLGIASRRVAASAKTLSWCALGLAAVVVVLGAGIVLVSGGGT